MGRYLALDLGATNTRCVIVDGERRIVARRTRATPQETTTAGFAETIGQVVDATLAATGIRAAAIDAAGIASFGPLDTTRGTITATPNLESDLTDVPVREPVADRLTDGTPVVVLNDAVAGAVAEHRRGGPEDNVVYLTLSSGIGAGAVVDGSVLRGRNGNAAEVGHFLLDPDSDQRCGCGGHGHWEAFAGGENIPTYARAIATSEEITTELPVDETLSAAQLFEGYGTDPLATATVDRVGEWNTIGVANLVHAFAPDRIAVGGSVALQNPTLALEPIVRTLGERLTVDGPSIHLTGFGDDIGVLGAAEYAIERRG